MKTTEEYLEELLHLANTSCKTNGLYYFLLGLAISGAISTIIYFNSINSYRIETETLKQTIEEQEAIIDKYRRNERMEFLRSEGVIKEQL